MIGNVWSRNILAAMLIAAAILAPSQAYAADYAVLACDDMAFSLRQALLAAELDDNFNLAKPKGKVVYLLIEAVNNGKAQKNIRLGMFSIVDQSGKSYPATEEASVSLHFPPVKSLFSEILRPDDKIRFALGFDLPPECELQKLKLRFATEKGRAALIDIKPIYEPYEKR